MKKIFTLFLALVATTCLWAYDFQSGDLYYNITSSSAPYTVEVTREYQSSSNYSGLTTATIPETVTYSGTTYSVTSIGDAAFYNCSSLTSITIPYSITSIGSSAFSYCSSLTSVTIPNSVTSIGYSAFSDCSSLTSITIPNSVTSIGSLAFEDCSGVTSITIPNSVTSIGYGAFLGCFKLTSVTIGNSVTSIGDAAFSGCSSLTRTNYTGDIAGWCNIKFGDSSANPMYYSHNFYINDQEIKDLVIPNSVTSIGDDAFRYCSSLTSVTIGNSVTSIGDRAFDGCSSLTSVTIPNSVTSIGKGAFSGCSSLPVENNLRYADTYLVEAVNKRLATYSIKEGTKWIGTSAFYYCSSLTSITIPSSVTSIGGYAFEDCSSLTSITIPSSVTSIGGYAFEDCSSLTSITIPNSVTSIGKGAFSGCSGLTSMVVESGNTKYDSRNNCNAIIETATNTLIAGYQNTIIPNSVTSIGDRAFEDCSSLTSITIPSSVTSIGDSAFYYCTSLTSVTIPNSVTSIGVWAFRSCSSLTSVTIGNSVTSIGDNAFEDCSSLTSVTIGNSVTSIGYYAFRSCSSLTSITCEAETPPTLRSYAFDGVSKSIPVYVPCGCVWTYKAASGWRNFTNFQEPQAEYSIQVSTSNSQMGTAKVDYNNCAGAQISATANYGYHFVQWSDGNTDNPRNLILTQDTVLTAEFAINQYTVTTRPSHNERGTTQGDTTVNYLENVTISATANYGYHFSYWNDYNYDNPRQVATRNIAIKVLVQVTEDKTYTAYFDKNTYSISLSCNNDQGQVEGPTSAEYLDEVTISATAKHGYHFVQWSDGVTDNPRTLVLTQDTTLTAEFAPNQYSIVTISKYPERGTTQGDTTANYLENITISATANYGYHFTKWNDGNTSNPRQVQVTENKTYTAEFEKNTYSISLSCNNDQGQVEGPTSAEYLDEVTISATANYGYHFVQWSDGVTDNPRTLVLTQDTTLTAEFAPNQYSIATISKYPERGTTQGDTTANYLENITISATANYGYHFTKWNDGNTSNPRQVQVTENKTYTAEFEKNTYSISLSCNNDQGQVEGPTSAEYLDEVTISATAKHGYHFVQWSDGNTDNPRNLILTQDTVLTAEFAQSFSGQCGDNLYWDYDKTNQTISITGSGDMYDYTAETQPWLLFKEEIKEVTIVNTATSIGTSAFEGCIRLSKISLGTGLKNIAANAFAGCTRLYDIYVYATYPPFTEESSFANYNVYVYIPCEYQRDYILDVVWGKFKFIECIGAESEDMGGDDVVVTPGSTDVTITWPTEEGADTYTIVIKKDGEVFCTLTFNADGQLLNIAFAPGRNGNHPAQYAEAVANGKGYRFTVTGLTEATQYAYNIDVRDADNKTINSHSGNFTTQSTTAVENTHSPSNECQKLLRDGQLIIIRDGVEYTIMGAEVR